MRLIDADVLLEPIADCEERETCIGCQCRILDCEDFEKVIKAAPTIAERKPGKWERISSSYEPGVYCCSECGMVVFGKEETSNYCPNCGAKMEGAL